MPGIRLHPNYHGNTMDDPKFDSLLALAAERSLLVQIAVGHEDERVHHRMVQAPDVVVTPLPEGAWPNIPAVRVILLNSFRAVGGEKLLPLASVNNVYAEIATIETLGGVAKVWRKLPCPGCCLVPGATFFLFYLESALLKLKESNLSEAQLAAIRHQNAEAIHCSGC